MKTAEQMRRYLEQLKAEACERARQLEYETDEFMESGFGLTKFDCNLIVTSLGHFLGFSVFGKQDWNAIVRPGQITPAVDGNEVKVPYWNETKGKQVGNRVDYTWFDDRGRCVGVFEIDGRDNHPSNHLPEGNPAYIKHHNNTNNLFSLSAPVLNSHFGYVPPIRLWILFQVDNDFSAKKAWQRLPQWWRIHFAHCDDLDGASIFSDTELFSDEFVEYINTGINSC